MDTAGGEGEAHDLKLLNNTLGLPLLFEDMFEKIGSPHMSY